MSCHVLSCHVMSCHVMSSHVFSRLVISCHVMSRLVMSCHVMSSHVFSRLVTSCHIMSSCSRILLPNPSSEPSKFFYYGGGVAPTRFSKPWPCAGIGATLSLWRRAHCERVRGPRAHFLRGRLRGSGVLRACAWALVRIFATWASFCVAGCGDRACCEHVAGMPRACRGAVPWGLGRVLYTHGQRAFRVAGCGDRACWEHAGSVLAGRVGGAVPWGLGSGRVARTHDFTCCDLCFAWQVWDFGCISALGKALDGGSAWQAQ